MEKLSLFIVDTNRSSVGIFETMPSDKSLPFPLNTGLVPRMVITLYLALSLLFGGVLRSEILRFIKSLSIRENPINLFTWYDQLFGGFMGLNIMYTLVVIHLPFPLASVIGEEACNWTDLMGTLYLVGQAVWSCLIAVSRILLIKNPNFFKKGIKESNFAFCFTLAGHIFIITCAGVFASYDKGTLYKLCTHRSVEGLRMLEVSCRAFSSTSSKATEI